jgi:hypothetical protein
MVTQVQDWRHYAPDHSYDAVVRGLQRKVGTQEERLQQLTSLLETWLRGVPSPALVQATEQALQS